MQLGSTALMLAAEHGHLPVVQHLASVGQMAATNRVNAVPTVSFSLQYFLSHQEFVLKVILFYVSGIFLQ